MSRTQWVSIDWDHTLFDTENGVLMEGAQDALDTFHMAGFKVVIHSANNPSFIRKMCEEHNLRPDAIWGESPIDHGAKPVAALYIDDRALHFTNWVECIPRALDRLRARPVKDSRGFRWAPTET